jgi:ubiquinol-cytochrome c reductase cytochrome b subunit
VLFFAPNMLGPPGQLHPGQPDETPAHIVPEWYFWPFYAILRAFTVDFFFIPAKLMGVLAMFARSWCGSSCPGWINRRSARATTARCSASSSGSA